MLNKFTFLLSLLVFIDPLSAYAASCTWTLAWTNGQTGEQREFHISSSQAAKIDGDIFACEAGPVDFLKERGVPVERVYLSCAFKKGKGLFQTFLHAFPGREEYQITGARLYGPEAKIEDVKTDADLRFHGFKLEAKCR